MLNVKALTSLDTRAFKSRLLERVAIIVFVTVAAVAALSKTEADPDLWGHLRFGLDTLQAGNITHLDSYSYLTDGQLWVNHEWLAEVIFAVSWTVGNVLGLTILKLTVVVALLGSLYRYLLQQTVRPIQAGIVLLLATPLFYPTLGTVRPQMFTTLAASLLLHVLVRSDTGHYRRLWLLPPLFLVWANLHGGFLAGLAILLVWAVVQFVLHGRALWQITPPVLASLVATFVNPHGPGLMAFLLRTATVPRPEVIEWRPLELTSWLGVAYLVVLAISLVGFIFSRRVRSVSEVVAFAVLALMPIQAVRHALFTALGFIFVAGPHVLNAWNRWYGGQSNRDRPQPVLLYCSLIGAVALSTATALRLVSIPHSPQLMLPVSAVALLKANRVTANMAVDFNWGEYTIWHLGPQVKVSIDGRRETVYSPRVYQDNLRFTFGVGDWDGLLADGRTDLALVDRHKAVYNLLQVKPGWVLVFEDESSALFARQDFAALRKLTAAARSFEPHDGPALFP